MAAEEVAKAFVAHYYSMFAQGPAGVAQLKGLYQPGSMLTFEGTQVQGPDAIIEKYSSVGKLEFTVDKVDVQPSTNSTAICIFTVGKVKIDSNNPLHFTEFFQLVSTGPGAYYVHNDIFRLVYS